MKVRIIKWKNVVDHCESDATMLKAFSRFYTVVREASWSNPQEVVQAFNNSDLVTCKKQKTSRIVFNIGQNKYRLIVGYYFASSEAILYVKFVGTHKQYDIIDVCMIDMFK